MAEAAARIEFRIPMHLKKEVEDAAALLGASLTDFATQVLVERARQVKQEHQLTVLSGDAAMAFAQMILHPPEPTEALRKTMSAREVEI